MEQITDDLWLLRYPLKLLGLEIGRNVTVVRLRSGELVVHSTGPFTPSDVAAIRRLGDPKWLLDVSRFHDSFSRDGRKAFPHAAYLVPEGFPSAAELRAVPLDQGPAAWKGEVEIRKIDGMPKVQEHLIFHSPSRTLIVADLLFNFGPNASWWTKFVAGRVMGLKNLRGMSPFFRLMIRDRLAFARSVREVTKWDFDRIIVAHGEIIPTGGKKWMTEVLSKFGLPSSRED